jgi:hypothetical protein
MPEGVARNDDLPGDSPLLSIPTKAVSFYSYLPHNSEPIFLFEKPSLIPLI